LVSTHAPAFFAPFAAEGREQHDPGVVDEDVDRADGVGAGDPAQRRMLLVDDFEQSLGELGGIVICLLLIDSQAGRVWGGPLGVVVDRQLGVGAGVVGEQRGGEKARLDDRGADAERLDLEAQRLHPPLDPELGGSVGGAERLAGDAGSRAARDDRARTLFRIRGSTARVTFIGPIKLVISCRSICSGVNSSKKPA
jgi:hypothetical protein